MACRPSPRHFAKAISTARPVLSSRSSCIRRQPYSANQASQQPFRPISLQCTRTYSASATTPPSQSVETKLTWNRFLELRKHRRRYGLTASVVFGVGCVTGGTSFILSRDLEAAAAQMVGLDPFIVMGLSTMGLGAVGWLLGPLLGNALFNIMYRKYLPDFALKEREFFNRIKKYRVDPISSSVSNPVPDYYGEKIGSVAGYRQWLKDQRAFNLKRGKLTF
ncbi:mitochondrial import protein Pam17 [Eremomyces bilateralis CBS 781.70]|uniref:Presequence translocated-associated motor subunit PAM17 n=1 Tax=Eremomyces bilateralis CBS 781.70 TaxID=1392243 RepID=A0A6G1GD60_9PEZI|nr:mitochondrial import protein Pam17 [Eremomyces bilateralis CBS 781.70]KAF1815963.1 mitochondrial import protein Pam17 [Eremomyces bilateralis CBS 781.70]